MIKCAFLLQNQEKGYKIIQQKVVMLLKNLAMNFFRKKMIKKLNLKIIDLRLFYQLRLALLHKFYFQLKLAPNQDLLLNNL